MTNPYATIRAALESIRVCDDMTGEREAALAALAELEKELAAAVAERDGIAIERDQARLTLREIAQILIEQIGSVGPENAINAALRACGVIESMATRLAAIDNAPTIARLISRGEDSRRYSYMPFECARTYAEFPKTAAADGMWREGLELIARPAKDSP